jgi:hypothetical protein
MVLGQLSMGQLSTAAEGAREARDAYLERDFFEEAIVDVAVAAYGYLRTPLLAATPLEPGDEGLNVATLPAKARTGRLADRYQATTSWRKVGADLQEARIVFRRESAVTAQLPLAARRAVHNIGRSGNDLVGHAYGLGAIWSEVQAYELSGDPANHIDRLRFDMEPIFTKVAAAIQFVSRAVDELDELARREAPQLWVAAAPEEPTTISEAQRRRRALEELAEIAAAVLTDGYRQEWLAYTPLASRLPDVDLRVIAKCRDFDFLEPHRQNGWLSMGNELEGAEARFTHRSELKHYRVDGDVWTIAESIPSALRHASHAAHEVCSRTQILSGASLADRTRLEREISEARMRFHAELKSAIEGIDAIGARNAMA